MTSLLLLRHGESTWNAERRWQGWADAPLSELGQKQAHDAAAHLGSFGLERVVSSDLTRARRTAEIIAVRLGLGDVVTDAGLRERDIGAWSGLTAQEVEAGWPAELAAFRAGRLATQPGGEPIETFVGRLLEALARLAASFTDDTVLVVSHGGAIRALERHHGAEPPPATPNLGGRWFHVDEAGIEVGEPVVPIDPLLATTPPSR